MSSRPSFSDIEPLLAERQVDKERDTLHCVFVCPRTHRRVVASAYIQQGDGFQDRLMDSASRSFWYELRHSVARTVCSFLPHGFVREVVEGAAWRMAYAGDDKVDSARELEAAAVEAFLGVQHEFQHDGRGWAAREVVSEFINDFERQLKEAPLDTRYEAEVAARLLAFMASVDGVDHAERDFLTSFAPAMMEGAKAPTPVELAELSPRVKPTIYMLASALALADQQQSSQEQGYLARLEKELELSSEDAIRLRKAAGQFIVEQCVALEGSPTPEEISDLARLGGISPEDVERVLVRRRKRSAI